MHVVALTGSIAAGKSTVSTLLHEHGATIIDADQIVHNLQEPGHPVFARIVAEFGDGMVRTDGTLDRAALRSVVLDDSAARTRLEAIVHPAVEVRRQQLLHAARQRHESLVIAEIPLLFESGTETNYDGVIVVDASVAIRRERLRAMRDLSAHDIDQLLAAQMPAAAKRARATWIVENDGDLASLRQQVEALWTVLPH